MLADDYEIDWFVDRRDELEGFSLLNRYFAIVQAHSLIERMFARIIESAIDYAILDKSVLGRLNFPNTTAVEKGFGKLKISLEDPDRSALRALARKRHLILHSGGWFQSEGKRKGRFAPVIRLEVTDAEVERALELVLRCVCSAVDQYRRCLSLRGLVGEAREAPDDGP